MLVQSGGHEPVRTPSIAPTFSMQNSSRSTKEQANDKGNALFSAAPARPHMMQPFMTPQKSGSASYSTPQNRSQLSSNVESLRLQQAAVPATPKRLVPNPTNIAIPPATLALPKKIMNTTCLEFGHLAMYRVLQSALKGESTSMREGKYSKHSQ